MTWSPFLSDLTSGPTSTTTPAPSWPRIAGKRPSGSAPESVNSSVWQIPVARISTITSPALGPSSCTVSIESGAPAWCATAARTSIARLPLLRHAPHPWPTANQSAPQLASPSRNPVPATAGGSGVPDRSVQGAERDPLPAFFVEVLGRQPALHVGAHRRPFPIQHREPRGVAIAPLDDHVLPESPLISEAEPPGRLLGGLVEVVALPFQPAIAELIEHAREHQEHRLRRQRRPLDRRRVPDLAGLDAAVGRHDVHIAGHAGRPPALQIDHCEGQRIGGGSAALQPAGEVGEIGERGMRQGAPKPNQA